MVQTPDKLENSRISTRSIAAMSIVVGLIVLALKMLAWKLTGSVALLSDGLESIVNVVTASVAFWAVSYAARPADRNHPYGHHKAEYFSAVIEGVMIVIAAFFILIEAYQAFLEPRFITAPAEGLAINGAATMINVLWAGLLIRNGRRHRSPALEADGKHLMTDVISSIVVVLGITLSVMTGWTILDPLLALLVAVNILWSGWGLIKSSVDGLMDVAVPKDVMRTIELTIAEYAKGAIEAHDLRTRQAGAVTYIDFHLVVDGKISVSLSHTICDKIEDALHDAVPGSEVSIHVEPAEKAKRKGAVKI